MKILVKTDICRKVRLNHSQLESYKIIVNYCDSKIFNKLKKNN